MSVAGTCPGGVQSCGSGEESGQSHTDTVRVDVVTYLKLQEWTTSFRESPQCKKTGASSMGPVEEEPSREPPKAPERQSAACDSRGGPGWPDL